MNFRLLLIGTLTCVCLPKSAISEEPAQIPKQILPHDVAKDLNETGITLVDGASSFVFLKDGKFGSNPLGQSGRTLKGEWKITSHGVGTGTIVEVTAKEGWMNGIQSVNEFRRIVFVIYYGEIIPNPEAAKTRMGFIPKEIYSGYWFIDEMTKFKK